MSIKIEGKPLVVAGMEPAMVVRNPRGDDHYHTYGGLTPFFTGLAQGKLLGTRCVNPQCGEKRIWLPPRTDCADCWQCTEWVEVPPVGRIYTHSTVEYPGQHFKLTTPCPLISVEIEGVCTRLMSYLKEGTPKIGMKVKAWFNTEAPTHSILDLAWLPA